MIVYHGTGDYNLEGLLTTLPMRRTRSYVRRKCFCTTTNFNIATLFAIRQTTFEALRSGLVSGIVLEYDLGGVADKDYAQARDPSALQIEREIAVFNVSRLQLRAVWRMRDKWRREIT